MARDGSGREHYWSRLSQLLDQLADDARSWRHVLAGRYGSGFADDIVAVSRDRFAHLAPRLAYIGGGHSHGYDLVECAALKLYHARGVDEFLPFYCLLDFSISRAAGTGLTRTMTLAEGHDRCDHRFKAGRAVGEAWPPRFLRQRAQ